MYESQTVAPKHRPDRPIEGELLSWTVEQPAGIPIQIGDGHDIGEEPIPVDPQLLVEKSDNRVAAAHTSGRRGVATVSAFTHDPRRIDASAVRLLQRDCR